MTIAFGEAPFGLRDVQVKAIGGSFVALNAAQVLSFVPIVTAERLRGGDKLVAIASIIEGVEWELSEGGVPFDVIDILIGGTLSSSGSTPDEVDTFTIDGAETNPWFIVEGRAISEDATSDMHVTLWKCKVESISWRMEQGAFVITECSGAGIDDDTNGVLTMEQYETATAIS